MELSKESAFLRFRNSTIQIQSNSHELLEQILSDLKPFYTQEVSIAKARHLINLNIGNSNVPIEAPFYSLPWKGKQVWGWGCRRFVLYPEGGRLEMEISPRGAKSLQFYFLDAEELRTQTLLCVQALWGEDAEAEGLVRIHSLSLKKEGQGIVVMADSGSGKSFFALKCLLDEKPFKVLSDETAWVLGENLQSFPTPIALDHSGGDVPPGFEEGVSMKRGSFGQKRIFQLSHPVDSQQTPLKEIIYFSADPSFTERIFWRLYFLGKLTLGYQLPQMFEILVRRDNFFFIFKTAIRRVRFGLGALVQNRVRPVFDRNFLSEIDL
ncbi:hypothetical protein GW915_00860 [bacterium]|nr:hypothetical protein [bacterium]